MLQASKMILAALVTAVSALNVNAPLPNLRAVHVASAAVRAPTVRLDAAVVPSEVLTKAEPVTAPAPAVDRLAQFTVKPKEVFVGSTVIVIAATALQVVTPVWMVSTFGAACEHGLGAAALGFVEFLNEMKRTNPVGLVLGHGIITKGCADVLAQTIPKQEDERVWIDSLRAFRSMMASILSTSLPFYYWTRFMAASMPVAPAFITGVLGAGFGTALFKTVVTQALFRPVNVFLFLFLQSVFRGDTARELVDTIRTKIKSSVIGGVAFYSVSNLLMYSVPVPFLHPIMGSVAGLIFNVWLAIVAYRK